MSGLGSCIGVLGQFPCCPLPNPYKEVRQGSVGLISRFGQFYKSVDPGLVEVNVCSETISVVGECCRQLKVSALTLPDVKIQLTTVPRQTVQTKDNVSVEIDSVISWHVVSPYRAAFGINNLAGALVERAQTTLRQVVGGRVLQSVISDREGLAQEVAEIIETTAEKWGVSIESILLKDINFSAELQQSLSSAATQKRIGESKVIAARAEVDAAKLMRQGTSTVDLWVQANNQPPTSWPRLPPCRSASSRHSSPCPAALAPRSSSVRGTRVRNYRQLLTQQFL